MRTRKPTSFTSFGQTVNGSARAKEGSDFLQHRDARGILPLLIRVGKVLTDVPGAGRTEDRVCHGVAHDVRIRMTEGAHVGRHLHAAKNQPPAGNEAVKVVTHADPHPIRACASPGRGFQVVCRRDLHVGTRAVNEPHAVPSAFREHRLVGRVDP